MRIIQGPGAHIIDGHAIHLEAGQEVAFRDAATVETFNSREAMEAEHRERFPEKFEGDDV
jgi:hypothetical protein